MRRVHIAENPAEAHFVKGLLESKGITASVREEGTIGDFPSVWVAEGPNFELAREVVMALSREQAFIETQNEHWYCPRCREQIEPQFTECWKCGTNQSGSL
jgi:hypothetical protein